MSDLLIVRFNKEPILPLYFILAIGIPVLSLSIFIIVAIGVLFFLGPSISNIFNNSLIYFNWCMDIPTLVQFIYNSRNKASSSIMFISNSLFIIKANSLHNTSLVAPKIMSPTYIFKMRSLTSSCFINFPSYVSII